VEQALRRVGNHPQVTVAHTMMNDKPNIQENIRIAGEVLRDSLAKAELNPVKMERDGVTAISPDRRAAAAWNTRRVLMDTGAGGVRNTPCRFVSRAHVRKKERSLNREVLY
jgi:hypothetical protein